MEIKKLKIKRSTSRGEDTYGWNVITLQEGTGKRYQTKGGGYDMVGTVFGDWLFDKYFDRLIALDVDGSKQGRYTVGGLYGLFCWEGKYYIDGGCGLTSMLKIADAIGLAYDTIYVRDGWVLDYILVWEASDDK